MVEPCAWLRPRVGGRRDAGAGRARSWDACPARATAMRLSVADGSAMPRMRSHDGVRPCDPRRSRAGCACQSIRLGALRARMRVRTARRDCGVAPLVGGRRLAAVCSRSLGPRGRWLRRGALGRSVRQRVLAATGEGVAGLLEEVVAALCPCLRHARDRDLYGRPGSELCPPELA